MHRTPSLLFILSCCFVLLSCDVFDYSPHEVILDESEKNLIAKGIPQVIQDALSDDTLNFIVTGDAQGGLDEVEEFVNDVNNLQDVDFTLVCGDLCNYGLVEEFKWLHRELKHLPHPYLPVIGNHDFIANGPEIFKSMYGPFDYSFKVGPYKFIAINTNSIEHAFDGSVPNIAWLEKELSDTLGIRCIFVYSHIFPWSADFDQQLEIPFKEALAKSKVKISFHGHLHIFEDNTNYDKQVQYLITAGTKKRSYLHIKAWNKGDDILIKRRFF